MLDYGDQATAGNWLQQRRNRRQQRADLQGAAFGLTLNMIIVSESSAKAARPVRTGRFTPAYSSSSEAHPDTHQEVDARRISVHTEEVADQDQNLGAPGRPFSGIAAGWARK